MRDEEIKQTDLVLECLYRESKIIEKGTQNAFSTAISISKETKIDSTVVNDILYYLNNKDFVQVEVFPNEVDKYTRPKDPNFYYKLTIEGKNLYQEGGLTNLVHQQKRKSQQQKIYSLIILLGTFAAALYSALAYYKSS